MTERSEVDELASCEAAELTIEDAIAELRVIRTNVSQVLAGINADSSTLSRKWRDEKTVQWTRRLEALTFAIERLEKTSDGH